MEGRPNLAPEPSDSIYFQAGRLHIIDQTLLPVETVTLALATPEEVVDAIRRLAVRGAPAIGIAGAYGALLAALSAGDDAPAIEAETRRAIRLIGE